VKNVFTCEETECRNDGEGFHVMNRGGERNRILVYIVTES
jgi:hypothetical protein